ncbi:hypothetical protein KDK_36650 [Dictyobacter kobayashii]|uniref:Uncharacterized protein n=2 Tax=Dictyobacter kobayashii TaxID=2014872 RepID=A0A402ALF3_9CHLR|nr:hypothetical protein KDK_36650 [Dictyobacter kobayashii]
MALQFINGLLVVCLFGCALCSFMRVGRAYAWLDRVMIFIVAIAAAALQLHLGSLDELAQTPLAAIMYWIGKPGGNQDLVFNVLLGWGPLFIALLWIFLVSSSTRLGRLSLVVLSLPAMLLQNTLGSTQTASPVPILSSLFATPFVSLLNVNQLVVYGLLVLGLIQFLRTRRFFTQLERISIYLVALMAALLQIAIWSHAPSALAADPHVLPGWMVSQQVGMEIVVGNQVGAVLFLWFIIGIGGAILGRVIWRSVKQARQENNIDRWKLQSWNWALIAMRLEHLMIWITTLMLVLALPFFGATSAPLSFVLGGSILAVDINQLVWWFLLFLLVVGLFRLVRPFSGWDRWHMLCNILTMALLFFGHSRGGGMDQHVSIIAWFTAPHIILPFYVATAGLVMIALGTLLWLKRAFLPTEQTILWLCFGLALLCTFLQLISPLFLLAACIFLFQGILFVMRVERVH